ncbi:MAG TPA: potassium-transporting ATPase subunit KdpB, partial [Desulfitobacterium dehalogenans]|nr:potassium-transporting ATPase subunit KdpB [Desulfitobacterium dehalogenans]
MNKVNKAKLITLITGDILKSSILGAFKKLNPRYMMRNPVMFVVEIGFGVTLLLCFFPSFFGDVGNNLGLQNGIVSAILLITLLFANFAEAVAEGRGKAQAQSLKKTQKDMQARILDEDGREIIISAGTLKKGDVVLVKAGELIPNDGEVIEGVASVDESAITGESAPVLKERGGDFASVTGGTTVVSDWLKIRTTSNPGESFLDKMIALVEGASRKKTPNEIALNTLLVSLTIIFLIVVVSLYPIALYSGVRLQISTLIALTVCLIPTTIGGLLSAIGIAGMDRVTRFNVIAMSGKAVEACGDVDTMILDKTGTITYGNRMAAKFIPVGNTGEQELIRYAVVSSLKDDTPEGKSVVELGERLSGKGQGALSSMEISGMEFIEFTAQTRMSGVNFPDGTQIRKGAADAIRKHVQEQGGSIPKDLEIQVNEVARLGGTPLVVSVGNRIAGVIYLKDTIKAGLVERFARLRAIGIKTIMCTGDNPLTA